MFLIPTTTHYGTIVGGAAYTDFPTAGFIDADDVPLPAELSGFADDWEEAISEGYAPFFLIDTDDNSTTLISLDQWTNFLDLEGNPRVLVSTINGVDYPSLPSANLLNFLSSAFSGEEVVDEYTWDQAYELANKLRGEMAADLNDYVIAGTPLDSSFAAINTVLKDLEGTYTVPADAISAMAGGLASFATSLGQSWPPPEP